MIREIGDMWSIFDTTDYFIVTTNSYIRQDGALVMGRGIAKQLATKIPNIPWDFANYIEHLSDYGLLTIGKHGAFQVKRHFKETANYSLIKTATILLTQLATKQHTQRIDMNFPGIGNGYLPLNTVLPIIQTLPDNVHIWTFT